MWEHRATRLQTTLTEAALNLPDPEELRQLLPAETPTWGSLR
jgi:hypothetical protein